MGFIYFIMFGLFIWLDWYLANQFFEVAQMKGYHNIKYFWIAFWCSFVGYLLIVSLPDQNQYACKGDNDIPEL